MSPRSRTPAVRQRLKALCAPELTQWLQAVLPSVSASAHIRLDGVSIWTVAWWRTHCSCWAVSTGYATKAYVAVEPGFFSTSQVDGSRAQRNAGRNAVVVTETNLGAFLRSAKLASPTAGGLDFVGASLPLGRRRPWLDEKQCRWSCHSGITGGSDAYGVR